MFQLLYTQPAEVVTADCAQLQAATSTIDIAAYSLTHPQIISVVEAAAKRGVRVRVYLDHEELAASIRDAGGLARSPIAPLINQPNIAIRVKESSILMHLKSYCVDLKLLRDGSANLTQPGESVQDNSAIWTDEPIALARWAQKFTEMWTRPNNLSAEQIDASISTRPRRERVL